jgi:hypothetical protein
MEIIRLSFDRIMKKMTGLSPLRDSLLINDWRSNNSTKLRAACPLRLISVILEEEQIIRK